MIHQFCENSENCMENTDIRTAIEVITQHLGSNCHSTTPESKIQVSRLWLSWSWSFDTTPWIIFTDTFGFESYRKCWAYYIGANFETLCSWIFEQSGNANCLSWCLPTHVLRCRREFPILCSPTITVEHHTHKPLVYLRDLDFWPSSKTPWRTLNWESLLTKTSCNVPQMHFWSK